MLGALLRTGDPKATKQVVDAYKKTKGDEQAAAELLDIPRRTLINWRERVPALAEALERIREERKTAEEAARMASKT